VWNGEIVRAFQQRLVDLGFGDSILGSGGVDGEFGDGTLSAFFQYANALFYDDTIEGTRDLWMHVTATSMSGDTPYALNAKGLPLMGVECRPDQ
jgi:hypothetical protein